MRSARFSARQIGHARNGPGLAVRQGTIQRANDALSPDLDEDCWLGWGGAAQTLEDEEIGPR
jgi:hypothetical protein